MVSPTVTASILMTIAIAGGGMAWYSFSTAYQEIEEMTDFTPLVNQIKLANEKNIKKFEAEIADGQGGKLVGHQNEQKIISGDITIPSYADTSNGVLYVALLDGNEQSIESRLLQGDIIEASKLTTNSVIYSIPVDFEIHQESEYTIVAFLDTNNDGMNTESDFVKSVSVNVLDNTRIQYFDIVFD